MRIIKHAAKNHRYVTVVTGVSQYQAVLDEMRANDGCIGQEMRQRLALNAFEVTAQYDADIVAYLKTQPGFVSSAA